MGLYHAEIIGKLGALAANLTYGASADDAMEELDVERAGRGIKTA